VGFICAPELFYQVRISMVPFARLSKEKSMATQPTGSKSSRKSPPASRSVQGAAGDAFTEATTDTTVDKIHQGVTPPAEVVSAEGLEQRDIPSFSDSREARIAEAAYWRAERRGFTPGGELNDWLEAEREVDSQKPNDGQ
jgi:DUF2934 family protein